MSMNEASYSTQVVVVINVSSNTSQAHPPDELANIHDENEDEAFGGPAPVPGNIKRRTTMDSMKALARRLPGIGNFGGRSTLRSQKVC
jgi:hypothetical protein